MMTDRQTNKWTEFPLVDSTPVRGRVKSFLYEGQIYPKFSYILIEPIECRQLEKLQIGVDRVINDVKVTFTNTYVYLFYLNI